MMRDAGAQARAEQDARWLAGEPRRKARAAKVDRFIFWLVIGIPGICILAAVIVAVIGPVLASIGLVPLLLMILIVQNAGRI
jgi:hypothetical protein